MQTLKVDVAYLMRFLLKDVIVQVYQNICAKMDVEVTIIVEAT